MVNQPAAQRIGRRILQQVDYAMGVTVDENRAVASPATEGKLAHTKLARRVD